MNLRAALQGTAGQPHIKLLHCHRLTPRRHKAAADHHAGD